MTQIFKIARKTTEVTGNPTRIADFTTMSNQTLDGGTFDLTEVSGYIGSFGLEVDTGLAVPITDGIGLAVYQTPLTGGSYDISTDVAELNTGGVDFATLTLENASGTPQLIMFFVTVIEGITQAFILSFVGEGIEYGSESDIITIATPDQPFSIRLVADAVSVRTYIKYTDNWELIHNISGSITVGSEYKAGFGSMVAD